MKNNNSILFFAGWILSSFLLLFLSCGTDDPIPVEIDKDKEPPEEKVVIPPVNGLKAENTAEEDELQVTWTFPSAAVSAEISYYPEGKDEANAVRNNVRRTTGDRGSFLVKVSEQGTYIVSAVAIDNYGNRSEKVTVSGTVEIFTDIDALMVHATGFTNSPQTPMGNRYANRHVTTDDDRLWLLDPGNEPPAPGSASHLEPTEFPVSLYPYGTPLPADVNQHAIGNCGGLAALASLAYIYPDFVMSLIKDNGDNTYTVSMFDPQGKPVEVAVTNLFLSGNGRNIDAVSGKNNTATWATVLEKAVMKYNCIYKVNTDIGGIGSEHMLPLFTGDGNSFAFSPGKLTGKELARAVRVSLRNGKLIIGGFNRGDLPVDGSKTVTAHAYTLMHPSARNALFAMRNPWGGNPSVDGSIDGVLNISNDGLIPPTIDLRIVDPGIAANFGNGINEPYAPPVLKAGEMQMRVATHLLNPALY